MVKYAFQIFILGLFALGSAWLLGLLESGFDKTEDNLRHDPDFYMENFTSVSMNEAGKPAHELSAEKLTHYPDTDTNELIAPQIYVYPAEKDELPWRLESDNGWVSSDNSVILLNGKVRIWQGEPDKKAKIEIITRDLRLLIDDEFAETDNRTQINTSTGYTHSIGMKVYLDEKRIELPSRVRSKYEPAKN